MKKLHQFFIFLSVLSPIFCLGIKKQEPRKKILTIVIPSSAQNEKCPIPPTPSPRK